jgi:hypothetical protein
MSLEAIRKQQKKQQGESEYISSTYVLMAAYMHASLVCLFEKEIATQIVASSRAGLLGMYVEKRGKQSGKKEKGKRKKTQIRSICT